MYRVLSKINSPADLKGLTGEEMEQLASEIREEMIRVVSLNGGRSGIQFGDEWS